MSCAGIISFTQFSSGVAWPQTGLFLDSAAAFALYFLRGLITSAVVVLMFCAVYCGAKYILATVRSRPRAENSEMEGLNV
ncbi:hypothetical protein C8R44DRAFT_789898 [Mycena epipterygia]|nr:hypothetical protein C8R44DRAFT_789898 [Mycena epipterygia]